MTDIIKLVAEKRRLRSRAWGTSASVRLACVGLFLILPIRKTLAGSIFDDDFAPPQRPVPASKPEVQPKPPELVPPAPVPAPAIVPPPVLSQPAVSPSGLDTSTLVKITPRRQIPNKTDQAQCRKLFREAFSDQLKDTSLIGRRKLARMLLDEAAKNSNVPLDYFVLLTGAIESGEEGSSLRMASNAVDRLAAAYDVDPIGIEADAVNKLWGATPTVQTTSVSNVQCAFDVIDQLLADDDLATAAKVAASLQRAGAAIVDSELKFAVLTRAKEVLGFADAREKLIPTLNKLKISPNDGPANTAIGSYLCFTRGQWEKGLPLLAKGDGATLKALASADLLKPADEAAAAKLADGWWDVAEKTTAPGGVKIQQHAAVLYRSALGSLSGVRKLAIEKRVEQGMLQTPRRRIDLFDFVDPATDSVEGKWVLENGALTSEIGGFGRIELPYIVPEEYDFRISFTVVQGNEIITQMCDGANHQFLWCMGGWRNTICAFEQIRGAGGIDNSTARRSKHWLTNGVRYTSTVKVRKTGIEAFLNEQLISSWKTDYSDMGLNPQWGLHDANAIGLGTSNAVIFDLVEVIEVTGRGRGLR